MKRLILVMLACCLSCSAYCQILPNGKTLSQQSTGRERNNTDKQPKKAIIPQTHWNNKLRPSVYSATLYDPPKNYKQILRSHSCWSVKAYNFRYSHKGRSYKNVRPQTKDIFRICKFTAKGVRVYYTPETAIPRSYEIPFFVEEFVPYDKVEVLGWNVEGEYVISVVLNKDWNAILRIAPSYREVATKHKKLVKASAKIAKLHKDRKENLKD